MLLVGVLTACAATAEAPTLPRNGREARGAQHEKKVDRPRQPANRHGSTTPTEPTFSTFPTSTTTPRKNRTRRVTMAFTGDTLTHSPLWAQAQRNAGGKGHDFAPMQARLEPLLNSVDLAVCHLETPIAPEGEQFSTAPAYGVPPEVVVGLVEAGYDRCSTASNHTFDRGPLGIDRTVSVLQWYGLEQSGMARAPEEISPKVFEVNGVKISHLSYTFSYNGVVPPAGQDWRSALIGPERIIGDATTARGLGAEVVFVSMHWGEEGQIEPTAEQLALADTITASGSVDFIVGHHAHVLQPMAKVNGKWVMYGLSNILSNLPTSSSYPVASQDAAVATLTVDVGPKGAVTVSQPVIHPTWVDRDAGWIVRLAQADLADPTTPEATRTQLEASLARTTMVLGPYIPTS